MITTMTITLRVKPNRGSIRQEVIECHLFDRKDLAIEGWFGYSKRYDSLYNAIEDVARRRGFTYSVLQIDDILTGTKAEKFLS